MRQGEGTHGFHYYVVWQRAQHCVRKPNQTLPVRGDLKVEGLVSLSVLLLLLKKYKRGLVTKNFFKLFQGGETLHPSNFEGF